MKVKIGETIYDANEQPIMLILDKQDRGNIHLMHPDATMYCAYPEGMDYVEVQNFMNIEDAQEQKT